MKKKIVEIAKKEIAEFEEKKISRKDAIKKTGYMALSAATMMILVNNAKAQTSSDAPAPPPSCPDKPSGNGPWKKHN
ncbi:MAG: hypothetical protein WAO52_12130 [Prolixibacteraceae bacterium]